MDVSVVVGTHGADEWRQLAETRALPSAHALTTPAREVIHVHADTLQHARNSGALQAKGEWLAFLDADDELHRHYIARMAEGSADLRGPAVQYINPDGMVNRPLVIEPMDLTNGNYLVIGTLVRREMFMDVGGFRDWEFYEDWCLWQRCWQAGATIEQLPGAVYKAYMRWDSRNRAPSTRQKMAMHAAIRQANFPHLYQVTA